MQDMPKIEIQVCSAICTKCRNSIPDEHPRWCMEMKQTGKVITPTYTIQGYANYKDQKKNHPSQNPIVFCENCFREDLHILGCSDETSEKLIASVKPRVIEGRYVFCGEEK